MILNEDQVTMLQRSLAGLAVAKTVLQDSIGVVPSCCAAEKAKLIHYHDKIVEIGHTMLGKLEASQAMQTAATKQAN